MLDWRTLRRRTGFNLCIDKIYDPFPPIGELDWRTLRRRTGFNHCIDKIYKIYLTLTKPAG